jgi:hypothetical protein
VYVALSGFFPFNGTLVQVIGVPQKLTTPVGAGPPLVYGTTVAVSVSGWPAIAGVRLNDSVAVVTPGTSA